MSTLTEETAAPGTVAVREGATTAAPPKPERRGIDGAQLWYLVRRYLCRYVSFRKPSDADLVTAWIFHACARDRGDTGMGQLIWRATPRLLILSRTRGAGKSTLLDLIVFLTGSRRGKVPRLTPARLAQITGQAYETVCIDEGKLVFGGGARQLDLQACLLAGYTPNASYEVSKTSLPLFGSVVIATKESLITEATKAVDGDESSLGDLLDRCLKVTLAPPALPMPEVGEQAEADGGLLARALAAWCSANGDELRRAARDLADEDLEEARERARAGERPGNLRAAQIARPLRAVARVIGTGTEQDVAAALEGTDEAAELMDELAGRAWASDGGDEEVTGRIVYSTPPAEDLEELPADGWRDELAAIVYDTAPRPAPVTRAWKAARAAKRPGEDLEVSPIPGKWDHLTGAMAACEAISGVPLAWEPSASVPGAWRAIHEPAGPEHGLVCYIARTPLE